MIKKILDKFNFVKLINYNNSDRFRLYDERYCNQEHAFLTELMFFFVYVLENNYNVYYINTTPIHNIILPQKDLNFIQKDFFGKESEKYLKANKSYIFEDKTLDFKTLSADDLSKIFDWGFVDKNILNPDNNISCFIAIPKIKDNLIYWEFLIISKPKFDINKFLITDFNLFKVTSITQLYENTLSIEFFEKLFWIENWQFFDNYKSMPNVLGLPEVKAIDISKEEEQIKNALLEYDKNRKQYDIAKKAGLHSEARAISKLGDVFLREKDKIDYAIIKKQLKGTNVTNTAKYYLSCICIHIHLFEEVLEENMNNSGTNFLDLVGGFTINPENENCIDRTHIQPSCFLDIVSSYDHNFHIINMGWFRCKLDYDYTKYKFPYDSD